MKKFYLVSSVAVIVFALIFAVFPKTNRNNQLTPALCVLSGNIVLKKCGLTGQKVYFTPADFKTATGNDGLTKIKINTLPSQNEGSLYVSLSKVTAGQTLDLTDMNKLVFVPESTDTKKAVFFISSEDFSFDNTVECDIFLNSGVNCTPVINNECGTLNTYKNIAVFSTFEATDGDGDKTEFEITKAPKHGTVIITDKTTGEYRYTPAENFTGSDVFEYTATDIYGNTSKPVKTVVYVEKNDNNYFFEDLKNSPEHYSAVRSCITGEGKAVIQNGKMCFSLN